MSEIDRLVQKPFPGVEVDMYDLDLTDLGGTIWYFTNWVNESGEKLTWRGNEYEPVAMNVTGYGVDGTGKQIRPRMRIGNAFSGGGDFQPGDLSALAGQWNQFVGATVTRWRTYRQFLDDGDTPDVNMFFPLEPYRVAQMLEETNMYIDWELSTTMDQEGQTLPRDVMTQKYCQHTYRIWDAALGEFRYEKVTCPYQAEGSGKYFTETNQPTNDPSKDVCSQRLEGCRLRFGTKVPLPIRAYPGMQRVTRRS